MTTGEINDCIVLLGPELEPWRCNRFAWNLDTIVAIDRVAPVNEIEDGTRVIIPGLINAHTHMGDSCWPDGATGLTLEQGFFRPNGFKYRELEKIEPRVQQQRMVDHLRYMARTGTVCHIDFREQGEHGAQLLRNASAITGVDSIILSQFTGAPFSASELDQNSSPLPPNACNELNAVLAKGDGFSESTMNDLTDPAWREIQKITRAAGKFRAIHCLENEGYRDVSLQRTRCGDLVRALELLAPDLIIHLTVANAEEIALLVRSRVTGVLNPRANANLGLPLPPIAFLMEAGANLMLGTDNGLLNSPNMLAELDFTYKVTKSQFADVIHPNPRDILRMATSNMPACFGPERRGFLEKDLPATFVVIDFSHPHLQHTRHVLASIVTRVTPEDVLATYRLGKLLYGASQYTPNSHSFLSIPNGSFGAPSLS